ncbi:MAG: alpha,alpha-trehalose-phosphate synthase (UDP-forming) [Rhodothermales bacterium]
MKLIIVSNRLPVSMSRDEGGRWQVTPSSGSLVTAMTPVLKRRGGLWIGWPDAEGARPGELREPLDRLAEQTGYQFDTVRLTEEERDGYYLGFSNEVLWPLFHDLQSRANFETEYWEAYQRVNRKFADLVYERTDEDDVVWVHDYHLMLVASKMRTLGMKGRIEFFLHTPFPPVDIFAKLPWRSEVLKSLLAYDATGFQTDRDRENYLQCVRHFVPEAEISGSGRVQSVRIEGHEGRIGSFPIAIDAGHFIELAGTPSVVDERNRLFKQFEDKHVILGVDRLDYTKGIPHRLHAYRQALTKYPELQGNVRLVQLVVPSRDIIPDYADLKTEIDQLVGAINGAFAWPGWVPVHYLFRGLPQDELVALYRAAHTMLVTPLKDGMNLVAKEYCATNLDEDGCLILSEFAGAAPQLQSGAVVVNPYDTDGLAEAIYRAYSMDKSERQQRMAMMRMNVMEEDIFWWVESFLKAAGETSRPTVA